MIAIVGLLSVLVYIAIRIILSASADDKAKYKTMLKDWFVAFCLLFFMHYIMAFATSIVEGVTTFFYSPSYYTVPTVNADSKNVQALTISAIKKEYADDNQVIPTGTEKTIDDYLKYHTLAALKENDNIDIDYEGADDTLIFNFTEFIRYNAQTTKWADGDIGSRFAYSLMYITLAIYTIMFLFFYIKRLVYIIFLTMIAPLVALTYPLDKIKDGSAQGFNTWLREYLFNLAIQPLHLFLYFVLIQTAGDIVQRHPIYAVIVMGMMLPIEKILKKMFGFEESQTVGSTGNSLLGGAAIFGAVKMGANALRNIGKGKPNKESGNKNVGSGDEMDQTRFRGDVWDPIEHLNGGLSGDEGENPPGGNPIGGNPPLEDDTGSQWADYINNNPPMDTPNVGNYEGEYTVDDAGLDDTGSQWADYINDSEPPMGTQDIRTNDGPITAIDDAGLDDTGSQWADHINRHSRETQYNAGEARFRWAEEETPRVGITPPKPSAWQRLTRNPDGSAKTLQDYRNNQFMKNVRKFRSDLNDNKLYSGIKAGANELGINGENLGKLAKGAAGLAGGAILGGTAAMVGMGAGLASDDFANAAKWGAGAGIAGAAAGNAVTRRAVGLPSSAYKKIDQKIVDTKDAFDKAYYGKEEAKRRINERLNDEHMKNIKVQKMYKEAFGKEWEKAMEASLAYRNKAGVTNNKLIINTMKEMKRQNKSFDNEEGITTAKLAKNVKSRDDIGYMVQYLQRNNVKQSKIAKMERNVLKVTEQE